MKPCDTDYHSPTIIVSSLRDMGSAVADNAANLIEELVVGIDALLDLLGFDELLDLLEALLQEEDDPE